MHCPTCNRERTRIYRVQSDGDPTSRVLTRLCKDPDCGTIFTTLESLLTVVQSPANRPYMREITGLLARLAPADLATVQKFLSSLPNCDPSIDAPDHSAIPLAENRQARR